jgi:hypothetical protein
VVGWAALQILTAPDNGLGESTVAATATATATATNGTWTADLSAGPHDQLPDGDATGSRLEPQRVVGWASRGAGGRDCRPIALESLKEAERIHREEDELYCDISAASRCRSIYAALRAGAKP